MTPSKRIPRDRFLTPRSPFSPVIRRQRRVRRVTAEEGRPGEGSHLRTSAGEITSNADLPVVRETSIRSLAILA